MKKLLSASPQRADIATDLVVASLLLILFVTTGVWGEGQNMDAVAAGLPAWSLAERGTLDLTDFASANRWIVPAEIGYASNRPPGVWLPAVPAYALASFLGDASIYWPSTLTSILVVVATILLLRRLLITLVRPTTATVAVLTFALATPTWYISARQLWPHGTAQILVVGAMFGAAAARWALAQTWLGAGILVRPPLAIVGATTAIVQAVQKRSLPTLTQVWPLAAGTGLLLLYNRLVFGAWSVSGGYADAFADSAMHTSFSEHSRRTLQMFFSPRNGLLIWSPFLIPLLPGLREGWRRSPEWARSFAIAGLVYILIHARLNRVSGGLVLGYRYQLTPLLMCVPLLAITYESWVSKRHVWRWAFVILVSCGIGLSLLQLFAFDCTLVRDGLVQCGFSLTD